MSTLDQKGPALKDRLRARPALYGSIAVAATAVLVVVLVVFQPQRLLYDNVVDDEFPVVESTSDDATMDDDAAGTEDAETDPAGDDGLSDGNDGTAAETGDTLLDDTEDGGAQPDDTEAEPEPSGPVALSSGDFMSRSRYTVTGDATVYELEDGSRTLRLEDFESTNGPSLFVYLTSADADAPDADLDADYIDLGALRGNVGNQNYDIPPDVDLEVYDTVVIWCRPFSVAFGAADLSGRSLG